LETLHKQSIALESHHEQNVRLRGQISDLQAQLFQEQRDGLEGQQKFRLLQAESAKLGRTIEDLSGQLLDIRAEKTRLLSTFNECQANFKKFRGTSTHSPPVNVDFPETTQSLSGHGSHSLIERERSLETVKEVTMLTKESGSACEPPAVSSVSVETRALGP
jgi:hypothetical protein